MEGESGPKARPNGVVDGKQVNIPVLILIWYRGTKEASVGQNWILAEALEALRGRRKTLLELKSDTVGTSSLFPRLRIYSTSCQTSKKSSNY